jgi:hypothetical protein
VDAATLPRSLHERLEILPTVLLPQAEGAHSHVRNLLIGPDGHAEGAVGVSTTGERSSNLRGRKPNF